MKALFILPNLVGGGAEGAMVKLADGFAERGHEATLLLLEDRREREGPKLAAMQSLAGKGMGLSKGWIGRRLAAQRLARWHADRARRFDLVVSTLPFADEIVGLARVPRVWFRIANNLSAEIEALEHVSWAKANRRRRRYRKLYSGQNIVAVSRGVADDMTGRLAVSPATVRTIYNPFDFDAIRRAAAAPDSDIPAGKFIVHAGSFTPAKRHDLLLRAFAAADLPMRLVLLTRQDQDLSAMVAAEGLQERVLVAGYRTNPYPWFARAAATVLTSDREGMPNVIVESLVCGTPVVSTDCPSGPSEILTGEMRRWLVPCGDADALAARLREVVAARPAIDPAILRPFEKQTSLDAYEALADAG